MLRLDVCIGAWYWTLAFFRTEYLQFQVFGWLRYWGCALRPNIEMRFFALGSPLPNESVWSSTSWGIRARNVFLWPSFYLLPPLGGNPRWLACSQSRRYAPMAAAPSFSASGEGSLAVFVPTRPFSRLLPLQERCPRRLDALLEAGGAEHRICWRHGARRCWTAGEHHDGGL
jgi:hypothetical protein